MLDLTYNSLNFSQVLDMADFYRGRLKETMRIKAMIGNCKALFGLPSDRVQLMVAEGDRVYKILLISPDVNKSLLGWFVYIPLKERVDFYTSDNGDIPYMQWKTKKLVFFSGPEVLKKAGVDKCFGKVIIVS